MKIQLIQFIRPDGRQRPTWADDMPEDLAPIVEAIRKNNMRFTAEDLGTGHVSICLEHREGDFDIEIAQNGPGENTPKRCLERIIRRFDQKRFDEWLKDIR